MRSWLSVARLGMAALTLVAIGVQLEQQIDLDGSVPNFFSFFTIQSNLFACGVLVYAALSASGPGSPLRDTIRGAAVTYMVIVGVVFALLLSGYQEELQTTKPWVNTVVHELMPIALVLDWLIDPPDTDLKPNRVFIWAIFPLAYVGYTMLRGEIVDWYPYPFLDPGIDGYGSVVFHSIGILIGMVVVGWAVIGVGDWRRSHA